MTTPAYGQVSLGTSDSATNPQRSGDATTGLFSSTADAVSISSGGVEIMRVNGTGVGIETASPASTLDVAGTLNSTGAATLSTGNYSSTSNTLQLGDSQYGMSSGGSNLYVRDNASNANIIFSLSSEKMRITHLGTVGIGTSSPAGTLDVEGGTAAASANGVSINLVAQNGGTGNENGGNIILTPGTATGTGTPGAVGIGTATPASPLTVNGTIQSLAGGFKFPDGTTQTTASTSGSNAIQSIHVQKFTSSGTYTPSAGMSYAIIEVVGGGCGGGGTTSIGAPSGSGAPGGGGGGYGRAVFSASSIGSSQTVTIGTGGAGGAAGNNPGSSGGTTSVGSLISASGGAGGNADTGGSGSFNTVASGGAGGSTISGATVVIAGQAGGGGGGGSTGTSNGIGFGGMGGNSFLGFGGAAVLSAHAGQAGTGYGSRWRRCSFK